MQIRLRLFASFREAVGQGALDWEARDGATVGDVLAGLREAYPAMRRGPERAMYAVNQEYVGPEYRLSAGDELALIPPVSGG
jgi:molybdopterin converting factor subunit 1